jgi:acid stress-induced BolA-like protein IbaG/YrbA
MIDGFRYGFSARGFGSTWRLSAVFAAYHGCPPLLAAAQTEKLTMAPLKAQTISKRIPASMLKCGDGHHWEAVIVSEAFRGKNKVQQHQLVYKALGDRMREEIHALSMKTLTPDQWQG